MFKFLDLIWMVSFIALFTPLAHAAQGDFAENARPVAESIADLWTLFQIEPQFLLPIHPDIDATMNAVKTLYDRYKKVSEAGRQHIASNSSLMLAVDAVYERDFFSILRAKGYRVPITNFRDADKFVREMFARIFGFSAGMSVLTNGKSLEYAVFVLDSRPALRPFEKETHLNENFTKDPDQFVRDYFTRIGRNKTSPAKVCVESISKDKVFKN